MKDIQRKKKTLWLLAGLFFALLLLAIFLSYQTRSNALNSKLESCGKTFQNSESSSAINCTNQAYSLQNSASVYFTWSCIGLVALGLSWFTMLSDYRKVKVKHAKKY